MCQYHYTKAFEALAYVDTFAAWGDAGLMFVVADTSNIGINVRDIPIPLISESISESWCYDIGVNAILETLVSD